MTPARWRLLMEEHPQDPELNLAIEEAIAERVGSGQSPPTIRLWRNANTLVLGRFDDKLPRFEEAVKWIRKQGVRVVKRISGGSAILHDICCANFSIVLPRKADPWAHLGVPEAYGALCFGILKGLELLGVTCTFGRVEGALCDGAHNLVVAGRKVGGTAQARRRHSILVHGTLFIHCDLPGVLRTLRRFYEAAGSRRELRDEAHTTLSRQLQRPLSFEEVCEAIIQGYRFTATVARGSLLAEEWALALRLKRRLPGRLGLAGGGVDKAEELGYNGLVQPVDR